jgi:membrane associated rhomboid family serine protease
MSPFLYDGNGARLIRARYVNGWYPQSRVENPNIEARTTTPSPQADGAARPRRSGVPRLRDISQYPVISGTALLATAVTLAWWKGTDIGMLLGSAEIRRGQWWRLITSVLPHLDIFHLVFNLYWLWVLGTRIEGIYGHLKTALLMLLLAIGSNAMEFALAAPGVGLSGVGYGLFGLLYVVARHDERFEGAIDRRTESLFIAWFFICIFLTTTNTFNVGNVAHGAGAVIGVLIAYAIVLPKRRELFVVAVTAVLLFGIWGSTTGRPLVNFSKYGGYEESQWAYDALKANKNQEAIRWFRDAVRYQPKIAADWYDLRDRLPANEKYASRKSCIRARL